MNFLSQEDQLREKLQHLQEDLIETSFWLPTTKYGAQEQEWKVNKIKKEIKEIKEELVKFWRK